MGSRGSLDGHLVRWGKVSEEWEESATLVKCFSLLIQSKGLACVDLSMGLEFKNLAPQVAHMEWYFFNNAWNDS